MEILNTEVGGVNTPKQHDHRTEDPTGLVGTLGGVATPSSGGDPLWSVDIATRRHRRRHPLRWVLPIFLFRDLDCLEKAGFQTLCVELPSLLEHVVRDCEKAGIPLVDKP